MYRYILRESCSQFDSLPLTSLTVSPHGFQHCSFVNSINTRLGGTHVAFIANAIASELCAHINGKSGGQKAKKGRTKGGKVTVKPNQVKNHLALWVNAQIHNPAFASQTKESLTTAFKNFGCAPALSPAFFKALKTKACGIVQATVRLAKFKTKKNFTSVARRMTRLRGIKKLDDANNAGTAKSHNCTLILTEGDSAKTLAVSGIAVVGRDNFGVFPLKGKPLNPRDEADSKVRANEELTNIVKIMGIDRKTAYTRETVRKLRYGSIMIMADQDVDGSHIKGLIINFLHWYNPSLLKCSGFLKQFITPLIRATKVSVLFMYRYILRESCSQFDSLPLTSLTVHRVEVAAALGSVYNRLASRLTAATLKEKVLAVLHTWEHWSLFPPFFLIGLEATFLDEDALDAGGPPSAARDALAAQLATIEESDIDGKDLRRKCKLAGVRDSGGGKQLMLRLHGVNAFVRARHGGAGEAYDPARAVAAAEEGGSVGVGAYGAAAPQAAAVATGAEEEEGDDDDIDGVPLDDDDVMDGAPF